ncbi:MAG: alpha/beta hydrolase family protein [Marinicellaceae bacterium]
MNLKYVHADCLKVSHEVWAGNNCTKIKTFKSEAISEKPILVVVLHGDSPYKKPNYQYEFARIAANQSSNVVAVGMLRPGYTDSMERTSDGEKGEANGDSYDKKRVDQIAQAITELKKIHKPSAVILAGHSGGSAITANIMSLYPSLIDHGFIVSCPCDVKIWRKDMLSLSKKQVFEGEINTLSPLELVNNLNEKSHVSMFVGNKDKITKPYISQNYKQAAIKSGAKVSFKIIQGKHDIFLNPLILDAMKEIIQDYKNKSVNED